MNDRFPIVVHGRRPWASPWRRPQQTHARLAARHPVLYLEPICRNPDAAADRLRVSRQPPDVWIAEPHLAGEPRGRADDEARVAALLRDSAAAERVTPAVHWTFGPIPQERLGHFPEPLALVYDVLDEAGGEDDSDLLRAADLVFTAGHELALRRAAIRPDARPVPDGVDFAHFHAAARLTPPSDLARIPPPRIGYSGVIDARLDLDALARLAEERPGDSIVLLGPVDGLAPGALPRARNLFYPGERPYRRLPEYFSGFSAGLLPFRIDGPAALANPETPLEWLSAGRPVVATPLADLMRFPADAVTLAEPAELARGIERALARNVASVRRGEELAEASPWDPRIREMELLVARVVQQRGDARSNGPTAAAV